MTIYIYYCAYAAHGKPRGKDMSTIQCFCCKGFGYYAAKCPRKVCNYCKKMAISSKNALLDLPRKQRQHILSQLALHL
jgi:hypothetical protein